MAVAAESARVMLRARFYSNTNFWIHNLETATWVPPNDDVVNLKELLDFVNERNDIKKALSRPKERA